MADDFQLLLINTFLDEAEDQLLTWERVLLEAGKLLDEDAINLLFRLAHNMKGSSRACELEDFGNFIHRVEDLIVAVRDRHLAASPAFNEVLLQAHSFLSQWIEMIREDHQAKLETKSLEQRIAELLDVKVSSPELPGLVLFDDTAEGVVASKTSVDGPRVGSVKGFRTETLRVAAGRIDKLLRTISELAIQNEILWGCRESDNLNSKLSDEAIALIYKGIKDLQDDALSLRMQSVQPLFQRLKRTAMDVAAKTGKEIIVEAIGDDVEIDKSMLDKLGDPLVHIIRNAVDHGIEMQEVRHQTGKAELAKVTIEASVNASGVRIEVSDNGRGLDKEKILAKAIDKGIVRQGVEMSDSDIFRLIMAAGFSTADKVTDVSGRGVGMDVVQQMINELGGSIEIKSQLGSGSRFILDLPSNLSITEALIVQVDACSYAVPLAEIVEVIDLKLNHDALTSVHGKQVIRHAKQVFSVVKASHFLRFQYICDPSSVVSDPEATDRIALILRPVELGRAVLVDKILYQQSIAIRPLQGDIEKQRIFSGGTILANGEPGMILNLKNMDHAV